MRNLNEDKFGIIQDDKHQFNSLEKAWNYVKGLKDKLKRKASFEEFPVTCMFPEDRLKYVNYGISLMTRQHLPLVEDWKRVRGRSVLWLIAQGYTFEAVANYLRKEGFGNVTIQKVKEVHKEAMLMVKDAIEHARNTCTPILGG